MLLCNRMSHSIVMVTIVCLMVAMFTPEVDCHRNMKHRAQRNRKARGRKYVVNAEKVKELKKVDEKRSKRSTFSEVLQEQDILSIKDLMSMQSELDDLEHYLQRMLTMEKAVASGSTPEQEDARAKLQETTESDASSQVKRGSSEKEGTSGSSESVGVMPNIPKFPELNSLPAIRRVLQLLIRGDGEQVLRQLRRKIQDQGEEDDLETGNSDDSKPCTHSTSHTVCCQGRVYEFNPGYECCGSRVYIPVNKGGTGAYSCLDSKLIYHQKRDQ